MTEEAIHRSPQTVARELDVSLATLRRWSDEFRAHLSMGASAGHSHRHYLDSDVAILLTIKNWVNEGMTYEQVHQQLNGQFTVPDGHSSQSKQQPDISKEEETEANTTRFAEHEDEEPREQALVATGNQESPALAFLTNTLTTLSDNQKSILNSQAANRELLGVLLQDNFNLKDENNRLRERILEVEREVAQTRKEEEWRRESLRQELEAKITNVTRLATEALTAAHSVETPEIRAIESKTGCLGMLLGRGGTQIISLPRRHKGEGRGEKATLPDPAGTSPYSSSSASSSHHPKPMFPPE